MSPIFDNTNIPVLQQVIQFAQARHEVLAGNVANWDTPGYRVRDLSVESFQKTLREAIEARDQQQEAISPGLMETRPNDPMRKVSESLESVLYHDDSNVSMEKQVTELAKNQYMHNMAIALMNSQFRMLQTAISERV